MAALTWRVPANAYDGEAKVQTGRVTVIDGLAAGLDADGMSLIQVRLLACQCGWFSLRIDSGAGPALQEIHGDEGDL